MKPLGFNINLSLPDARALLALLESSDTFPDVVDALKEELDVIDSEGA